VPRAQSRHTVDGKLGKPFRRTSPSRLLYDAEKLSAPASYKILRETLSLNVMINMPRVDRRTAFVKPIPALTDRIYTPGV
jgi:hypothetical protein